MTAAERVQALMDFRFTERQARFLELVMRHAGVCVPRQYARFVGIARGGGKSTAFFATLITRGHAVETDCVHNRAGLYRVHSRRLYQAINEPNSRYRRAVPARAALERLMMLDAVLATPNLDWLTTDSEKAAYVARLKVSDPINAAPEPLVKQASPSPETFPGTNPIGLDSEGRAVLLYLATVPWTDDFRRFLHDHAAVLRLAPTWALRLVFPRPVDRSYEAYRSVVRELETPLHEATIRELKWHFEHRRTGSDQRPDRLNNHSSTRAPRRSTDRGSGSSTAAGWRMGIACSRPSPPPRSRRRSPPARRASSASFCPMRTGISRLSSTTTIPRGPRSKRGSEEGPGGGRAARTF